MDKIIIYCCLGIMLVCGVLAVMLRSIIKDAICLAAASAALGVIMYTLGATWAAVFEVSVCSGLITVIFISGISLSHDTKSDVRKEYDDTRRMAWLPIVLVAAGAAIMAGAAAIHFNLPVAQQITADFREILWNTRRTDILGQIVVMLTGGTAISVLLREERKKS